MKDSHPLIDYRILTAIILLLFVFPVFITKSIIQIPIRVGNFLLPLQWRMIDLIAPTAAFLAGIGVYTFTSQAHSVPFYQKLIHSILPVSLVLAIGIALRTVSVGLGWAAILTLGGTLLYLIFYTEFSLFQSDTPYRAILSSLLSGLIYATFFIFAIGIRTNVSRLILELPMMFFIAFLLFLRALLLQNNIIHIGIQALILSFLVTQAAAAFHYYPLKPLSYGLALCLLFYTLFNITTLFPQKLSIRHILKNQIVASSVIILLIVYSEFIY